VFSLLWVVPILSYAGGGIIDPIEYENFIANNTTAIHSATSLLNQAQQLNNQIHMIENAVKNTGRLSRYQWHDITTLIQRLDSITRQGQALSYSAANLDDQFRQKYPDYTHSTAGHTSYSQAC